MAPPNPPATTVPSAGVAASGVRRVPAGGSHALQSIPAHSGSRAAADCDTALSPQPQVAQKLAALLRLDNRTKLDMEETDAIGALAALAQPVRLQIFRALVVTGRAGLTPGTMAEGLNIPASTLSFHLKELARAGLVTHERASRNLVYRAAYGRMDVLVDYLTAKCCQGAASIADPASPPVPETNRRVA